MHDVNSLFPCSKVKNIEKGKHYDWQNWPGPFVASGKIQDHALAAYKFHDMV